MESELLMQAAPHRQWYIAGDIVKVRVSLTCVPRFVAEAQRSVAPQRGSPNFNYFSVESSQAEPHEMDVLVQCVEADMVGSVDLDTAVVKCVAWPGTMRDGEVPSSKITQRTLGKAVHILYDTHKKTLRKDFFLKRHDCVAMEFTLRLPEGSPSTFKGKGAEYRHEITVEAKWNPVHTTVASQAGSPQVCRTVLPLIVFNSVASVVQLPLLSLFPLPASSSLVSEDFHFAVVPLGAVPTPSIAAPLTNSIFPTEVQLRTSFTVRQDAKAATQSSIAAQLQPLSLTMPSLGIDVVQVHLRTSSLALGDYLQGSFTILDADHRGGGNAEDLPSQRKFMSEAPSPVSAIATLELLECVTPEWALKATDASATDTRIHGMQNFVCVNSRVVEQMRFSLLDTISVPFEFSLPLGFLPPSTFTDITSLVWQLRVVVTVVSRKAMEDTSAEGVSLLGPLLDPVAGVFPLLVVPPAVPAKVRQGRRW